MNTQDWIDKGFDLIVEFGPKLIGAILIWIIGSWIVKALLKGIKKAMVDINRIVIILYDGKHAIPCFSKVIRPK